MKLKNDKGHGKARRRGAFSHKVTLDF